MHGFHDVFGKFPNATTWNVNGETTADFGGSTSIMVKTWPIDIFRFLEQGNLYAELDDIEQFGTNGGIWGEENEELVATRIPSMSVLLHLFRTPSPAGGRGRRESRIRGIPTRSSPSVITCEPGNCNMTMAPA